MIAQEGAWMMKVLAACRAAQMGNGGVASSDSREDYAQRWMMRARSGGHCGTQSTVENVFSEPVPLDGGNLEILGLHECMMIHGSDILMHVHVNVNELYIRRRPRKKTPPSARRPPNSRGHCGLCFVGLGQRLTRGGSRVAFGLSLWSLVWGLPGSSS
jgi:hypothetical protein